MHRRGRELWATLVLCASLSGCASMRQNAPSPDLRPCTDGYAYTRDGWRLGVRHYRPAHPDPGKLPVILCHGLGLNATFWTITDNHLPAQLSERGYEVYVFDIRGSGENGRPGRDDRVNRFLRQTPLRERGESSWTVDDLVRYDVPAILDYVERETGQSRVNWVGHSLGGMMMFPFIELSTEPERIATFVGMGSTIIQAKTPQTDMLQANLAIRALLERRQRRANGPAPDVFPDARHGNHRRVLLHGRKRRSPDDFPVLRVHARRSRTRGPAAVCSLSEGRPPALG